MKGDFKFPACLSRQNPEAVKFFENLVANQGAEYVDANFSKVREEFSKIIGQKEYPFELARAVGAYKRDPILYLEFLERINRISFPITTSTINEEAEEFVRLFRERMPPNDEGFFYFHPIFCVPVTNAVKEYQRNEAAAERERRLEKIEYPEDVKRLMELINRYFQTQDPEERKKIKLGFVTPSSPFNFYYHTGLTAFFSDITRFDYPIQPSTSGKEDERMYLGYNDATSNSLYLVPIDSVFFQVHKAPDMLVRLFEIDQKFLAGNDKFARLVRPAILDSNTKTLKLRGKMEVQPYGT